MQRGFIVSSTVEQLIVTDEVVLQTPPSQLGAPLPPLWWSLHTVADVSLGADGLSAEFTMTNVTGTRVTVKVLPNSTECPGAVFALFPINLEPPLLPTPNVKRLTLAAPSESCTRLSVAVGIMDASFDLSIRPLSEWDKWGPLF